MKPPGLILLRLGRFKLEAARLLKPGRGGNWPAGLDPGNRASGADGGKTRRQNSNHNLAVVGWGLAPPRPHPRTRPLHPTGRQAPRYEAPDFHVELIDWK